MSRLEGYAKGPTLWRADFCLFSASIDLINSHTLLLLLLLLSLVFVL